MSMDVFNPIFAFNQLFEVEVSSQLILYLKRFNLIWNALQNRDLFQKLANILKNDILLWTPTNISLIAAEYEPILNNKVNPFFSKANKLEDSENYPILNNLKKKETLKVIPNVVFSLIEKKKGCSLKEIISILDLENISRQSIIDYWILVFHMYFYVNRQSNDSPIELLKFSDETNITLLVAGVYLSFMLMPGPDSVYSENDLLIIDIEKFKQVIQMFELFGEKNLGIEISKQYLANHPLDDKSITNFHDQQTDTLLDTLKYLNNYSYLYLITGKKELAENYSHISEEILKKISQKLRGSIIFQNSRENSFLINFEETLLKKDQLEFIQKITILKNVLNSDPIEAKRVAQQIIQMLKSSDDLFCLLYNNDIGFVIAPEEIIGILISVDLFTEAGEIIQLLIKFNPLNKKLLRKAAILFGNYGDHEKAIELFSVLSSIDRLQRDEIIIFAGSLEYFGQWDKSFVLREEINLLNDDDLIAFINCAFQTGKIQSVYEILKEDRLSGKNYLAEQLSELYRNGQWEIKVEPEFIKDIVKQTNEKDLPIILFFSELLEDNNQNETAQFFLEDYLKRFPKSSSVAIKLAQLKINNFKYEQSKDLLEKASFSLQNISQFSCEILGKELLNLGSLEKAKQIIDDGIKRWPLSPTFQFLKGKICLEEERFEEAKNWILPLMTRKNIENEWIINYCFALLGCREIDFPAGISQGEIQNPGHLISIINTKSNINGEDVILDAIELELSQGDKVRGYENLLQKIDSQNVELSTKLLIGLGKSNFESAQYDAAIINFKEVLRLKPENLKVLEYLIRAYSKIQLWTEVFELLSQLSFRQKISCEWLIHLQKFFPGSKNWKKYLESQVENNPENKEILLTLIMYLSDSGWIDQAKKLMREKNILAEIRLDHYLIFSQVLINLNEIKEAQRLIEVYLSNQQYLTSDDYLTCAFLYDQVGEFNKALVQMMLINLKHYCISAYQAYLFEKRSEYEKASVCIQESIDLFEKNQYEPYRPEKHIIHTSDYFSKLMQKPQLLFERAVHISQLAKDIDLAMKTAEMGISIFSDNIRLHQILIELGRLMQDETKLEKIKENILPFSENELTADFYCLLGELSLEKNEEISSANYLSKALKLDDQSPRTLAIQARMVKKNGNFEEANQFYKKAKQGFLAEKDKNSSINNTPIHYLWIAEAAIDLLDYRFALDICIMTINDFGVFPLAVKIFLSAFERELEEYFILERLFVDTGIKVISKEDLEMLAAIKKYQSENQEAKMHFENAIICCEALLNRNKEDFKKVIEMGEINSHFQTFLFSCYQLNGYSSAEMELNSRIANSKDKFFFALLVLEEKPEKSLALLREIHGMEIKVPFLHAALAVIEERIGNLDEAYAAIMVALDEMPEETGWQKIAVRICLKKGNNKQALLHYERTKDSSNEIPMEDSLNALYLKVGDLRALDGLLKSLMDDPGNGEVKNKIGEIYLKNRKFQKAAYYLEKARNAMPNSPIPLVLLSDLAIQLENPKLANAYIENAFKKAPNNEDVLIQKAKVLNQQNGRSTAIDFLKEILQQKRLITASLLIFTAKLIADEYEYKDAICFLNSFIEILKSPEIYTELSSIQEKIGDLKTAAVNAELALSMDEKADYAYAILGKIALQEGDLDKAIDYFLHAIQINPLNDEYFIKLSEVYLIKRELVNAMDALTQGLKFNPFSIDLLTDTGKIFLREGLIQESKNILEKANQINPNSSKVIEFKNELNSLELKMFKEDKKVISEMMQ